MDNAKTWMCSYSHILREGDAVKPEESDGSGLRAGGDGEREAGGGSDRSAWGREIFVRNAADFRDEPFCVPVASGIQRHHAENVFIAGGSIDDADIVARAAQETRLVRQTPTLGQVPRQAVLVDDTFHEPQHLLARVRSESLAPVDVFQQLAHFARGRVIFDGRPRGHRPA